MYDHEITLIAVTYERDDLGQWVPAGETRTPILCDVKSIGRAEHYRAAAVGLKPEIILVIHAYEYDGQAIVEFKGQRYDVMRTYRASYEELELTCTTTTNGREAREVDR